MAQTVDAIRFGKWKVGFDPNSRQAVIVMEFVDRPPMTFVAPLADASALGRALIALDDPGQSSPARAN